MTRKDYKLIAEAINKTLTQVENYDDAREAIIAVLIPNFINKLGNENSNFDSSKFKTACLDGF